MTQLDALVGVLLAWFALRGWQRGLVREAFGLAGVAVAIVATPEIAPAVATLLEAHGVEPLEVARWLALPLVFVAVWVAFRVGGFLVHTLVGIAAVTALNRAAGLAFGVAKGVTLMGLAVVLAERLVGAPRVDGLVADSRVARPLVRVAGLVAREIGLLPPADAPERA